MPCQHQRTTSCSSAGRVTARLLLSFLSIAGTTTGTHRSTDAVQNIGDFYQSPVLPPIGSAPRVQEPLQSTHKFTLRHLFHHGTYLHPALHRRKDVLDREATLWLKSDDGTAPEKAAPLIVHSRWETIQRLVDRRPSVVDPMVAAAREHGEVLALSPSAWTMDDVAGPNVTDKDTIIALAQMSADAYVEEPHTGDWQDVQNGFNSSLDFGWESDGLRGHVFADENNSTVIISIKGTSVAVYDGIETTTNDKENDNLFFSCCCGQQGSITHRKVCDCATSTYSCNDTCVTKSLMKENRYYAAARNLYSNVTELYPDSAVWLTGHSLGGSVSSFLGMTYGLPTVTFEAPPDALAAGRLGLPAPPGSVARAPQTREYTGTYHFGHTADPLYLGICTGASSLCSFGGYAMESACHSGFECVYDVVADKGWRVGLATHKIKSVIKDILKVYDTVPECVRTPECVDCPLWKRYQSNSSETTSTSSTSMTKTRTRTETCKTPGWWGCLDETTTSGRTATSDVTTTTSTSTCKTPGWFGCRDEITTTTTSRSYRASASPTPTATKTSTATCKTPGWFGACNDAPTGTLTPTSTHVCKTPSFFGCNNKTPIMTKSHAITSPPSIPTTTNTVATTTATVCTSKQWFGLICIDPSPAPGENKSPTSKHCVKRTWLRKCLEWKIRDSDNEQSQHPEI